MKYYLYHHYAQYLDTEGRLSEVDGTTVMANRIGSHADYADYKRVLADEINRERGIRINPQTLVVKTFSYLGEFERDIIEPEDKSL